MDQTPDVDATLGNESDTPYVESTVYEEGITWGAPSSQSDSYTAASSAPTAGTTDTDDVDQVRSQIEQTRSEMSSTIDAIQQKLSPSNLVDEAKSAVQDATIGTVSHAVDSATDTVGDVGNNIVESIRQNPIPAALAGVGIGWLLVNAFNNSGSAQRRAPRVTGTYPYPGRSTYPQGSGPYDWYYNETNTPPSYPSGYTGYQGGIQYGGTPGYGAGYTGGENGGAGQNPVGEAVSGAQDAVFQAANQVQDTASQVAGQVQDTAAQVANQVQDTAGQVAYGAGQTVQQATTGLQRLMQQRPLAVGLMALGLGAAIGLAIPETEKEDELMGPAHDDLMQRATQTAQQTMQKVEAVAGSAADAAKNAAQQEAQTQGLQ